MQAIKICSFDTISSNESIVVEIIMDVRCCGQQLFEMWWRKKRKWNWIRNERIENEEMSNRNQKKSAPQIYQNAKSTITQIVRFNAPSNLQLQPTIKSCNCNGNVYLSNECLCMCVCIDFRSHCNLLFCSLVAVRSRKRSSTHTHTLWVNVKFSHLLMWTRYAKCI